MVRGSACLGLLAMSNPDFSGLFSPATDSSCPVGMTLVLVALKNGDVGTVAILSSVSPVLLLPLLWLRLGRPPAPAAWLGAGLTVVGTGLILLR